MRAALGWVIILGILVASMIALRSMTPVFLKTPDVIPPQQTIDPEIHQEVARLNTRVTVNRWSAEGSGTIAVADLTLSNGSKYDIKDITLECHVSAPSGTRLATLEHTVYEFLAMRDQKRLRSVNLGFIPDQAQDLGCSVASVTVVAGPR